MKKNRYALGALAVAVTALASAGSALAAGAPIDEKKASAAVELPAGTAVQAPLPEVKQKKALTAEEWKAITARLPKAELMNGFAVHSKHFCASCHGKEGLADTLRRQPSSPIRKLWTRQRSTPTCRDATPGKRRRF